LRYIVSFSNHDSVVLLNKYRDLCLNHEKWDAGRAAAEQCEYPHKWQKHLKDFLWFVSVTVSTYCCTPLLHCCKKPSIQTDQCLNYYEEAGPRMKGNIPLVQD